MPPNRYEDAVGVFWRAREGGEPQPGRWERLLRHIPALHAGRQALPFGARIATDGFLSALSRHFPFPLRVYTDCGPAGEQRRQLAGIGATRKPLAPVRVRPDESLLEDCSAGLIKAWLEPSGDFAMPLRLREVAGAKPFPVVATHHTLSYPALLHGFFLAVLLSQTYPFDALVCTSRAAREALANAFELVAQRMARTHGVSLRFNGSTPVVPLGIDTDVFRPLDRDRARSYFALSRQKLVLVYLGRLSVTDKADLLPWLVALSRLPGPLRARLEVVIAGIGPVGVARTLREYARSVKCTLRVTVLSPFPDSMRAWLYSAADIFLSPADSVQETFGIAPLEAMACGVPQVVSDWNGYRDTVADGETGFLIPTYWCECDRDTNIAAAVDAHAWPRTHFLLAQSVAADCNVFARRIILLAENEGLRLRMAEASRKRAVQCYRWEEICRRYAELLESLLDEARRWQGASGAQETPYYQPAYFRLYRRYASAQIAEQTILRTSGTSLEDSDLFDELPYKPLPRVQPQVLRHLCRELGEGGRARAVSEIVAECQRTFPALPRESALRHLMWLIKYGFALPDAEGGHSEEGARGPEQASQTAQPRANQRDRAL